MPSTPRKVHKIKSLFVVDFIVDSIRLLCDKLILYCDAALQSPTQPMAFQTLKCMCFFFILYTPLEKNMEYFLVSVGVICINYSFLLICWKSCVDTYRQARTNQKRKVVNDLHVKKTAQNLKTRWSFLNDCRLF